MTEDPNDRDWGDNKVAPFNYYVREVLTLSQRMDDFDLHSEDAASRRTWNEMRAKYVEKALKLVNFVASNSEELRQQLNVLIKP